MAKKKAVEAEPVKLAAPPKPVAPKPAAPLTPEPIKRNAMGFVIYHDPSKGGIGFPTQ